MAEDDERSEDFVVLTILVKGCTFNYVVPSFSVFNVNLTEVKLQREDGDGEVHSFDGFARDCNEMDHPLPAVVKIYYSYENAFIIEVHRILQLDKIHCLLYVLCIFVLI